MTQISIDTEELWGLYQGMLTIRELEESLVGPIERREINCPCHLYSGQEAVAVGISSSLSNIDTVFGNHRSHGHYLAKGGNIKQLVAEFYCKEAGCARGRGGSMHIIDRQVGMLGSAPIVGGTISLALGAALANKVKRNNAVSVSYFGDGATGEGVLYECLNFASLKKLPLLFVCENNLYSTHMPIDEIRSDRNISLAALPFNVKSFQCDGNDVVDMVSVGREAVARARENGPVFIEALTYRQRGHVGPDDNIQGTHTDIRPGEEISDWLSRDPINNLEEKLKSLTKNFAQRSETLKDEIRLEIEDAHVWATMQPSPDPSTLSRYVYGN